MIDPSVLRFFSSACLTGLAFLAPSYSYACSVCFGDASKDVSRGYFWGIMVLLLLPFLLVTGLIGKIAYHVRKNQKQGGVGSTSSVS
jgi:hypothetical protein